MKYYSTISRLPTLTLEEAVVRGLAGDKGLYMPREIKPLPASFYDEIENLSFQKSLTAWRTLSFGEDVPADVLKQIVYDTLSFDAPVMKVKDNIYSLSSSTGLRWRSRTWADALWHVSWAISSARKKEAGQCTGSYVGRYGSAVAYGFPGCGRHSCVCALPEREGERDTGKAVHHAGQNISRH